MITIAGLGPGDYDRIPGHVRSLIEDPEPSVVVRTMDHPAARVLADRRPVVSCDDIYESAGDFTQAYRLIADRVLELAGSGPVLYLVPGSPLVGEFAVGLILAGAPDTRIVPTESFIDAVLAAMGYDPMDRGLQVFDAHDLPDPLILDKPTIVAQVDIPEALADALAAISAVTPDGTLVTALTGLGTAYESATTLLPEEIDLSLAGFDTSLFVDPEPGGLIGAVRTVRRLAEECPWDREQTHKTLVKNLVEETYELIDAIGALPEGETDWMASAAVEDELGDLLLQVLMHEAIGRRDEAFDIDSVAEGLRQKLVRRHPHIFGDVKADTAAEVKENWDRIKAKERRGVELSALDGIPVGIPAIHRAAKVQNRAAKVGFDWPSPQAVLPKIVEEVEEVEAAIGDTAAVTSEIGDLLFSIVNVARHLDVDPELALRKTIDRFERRFRMMEGEGSLDGLTLGEMDERWERAKKLEKE